MTGSLGYLPSTYLARLMPGERVFRVNQHCQMEDLRGELVSLNRDQVNIDMADIEYFYLIFYPGCNRNVKRVPREYKPGRGDDPYRGDLSASARSGNGQIPLNLMKG